jgi:hypothetical protein
VAGAVRGDGSPLEAEIPAEYGTLAAAMRATGARERDRDLGPKGRGDGRAKGTHEAQ